MTETPQPLRLVPRQNGFREPSRGHRTAMKNAECTAGADSGHNCHHWEQNGVSPLVTAAHETYYLLPNPALIRGTY